MFNLLKDTGHVMNQQFNIQQLYVLPTLYLCFVFIWEQTATCATYSINWLVFITEIKSVYCAVRTGSLNKAVSASDLKGLCMELKEQLCVPNLLKFLLVSCHLGIRSWFG